MPHADPVLVVVIWIEPSHHIRVYGQSRSFQVKTAARALQLVRPHDKNVTAIKLEARQRTNSSEPHVLCERIGSLARFKAAIARVCMFGRASKFEY